MTTFTESDVEQAALDWFSGLGWLVAHGPDIAPDTSKAERADYGEVILERRLRGALERLNLDLSVEALDDAFRKLTHSEGSTLEARNHAFRRMLVDGVTVEYRSDNGVIRGAQAQVIDFDDPVPCQYSALGPVANTDTKLLIYGLFQKGRVLAQDGVRR